MIKSQNRINYTMIVGLAYYKVYREQPYGENFIAGFWYIIFSKSDVYLKMVKNSFYAFNNKFNI